MNLSEMFAINPREFTDPNAPRNQFPPALAPEDPFERAAARTRRAAAPGARPAGNRLSGLADLLTSDYPTEPDLQTMQSGAATDDAPEGFTHQLDSGELYNPTTGETRTFTRRPGVLPVTKDPSGKTVLALPRALDVVGNMQIGGLVAPPSGRVLASGLSRTRAPAAPAIVSRAEPSAMDIENIQRMAKTFGRKAWPEAPEHQKLFRVRPEDYGETAFLVPQVSIKSQLPRPVEGVKLPIGERVAPVIARTDEIAASIAERLHPLVQRDDPLLHFYHTAPVIRGIQRFMTQDEALQHMRNWAGQGAATSPRTQTPPNLRNSSFLMYERARGEPMTPARFEREGNTPGYPMMGMHVDLADQFARGTADPWINPKPFTFRENWSGNLRDVTGDTHNFRATLYELDRLDPGQLPRGWFKSDAAYKRYKEHGYTSLKPGDIDDTLTGQTVKGRYRQSEYLPMTEPWYRAAEMLNIDPAAAQSGGWFSYGNITGLKSPPKTIPDLLNDQIASTARVAGVSPERALEWWARGKIPLTGLAGGAYLGGGAMSDLMRQDQYQ